MVSIRKGNRNPAAYLEKIADMRQEEESSNVTGEGIVQRAKARGVLESFRSSPVFRKGFL